MALQDDAPIVPGTGYVFMADPDTAKPTTITDPLNPGAGWINFGHTSRDDMPEFGRDGDDPTTLGSWQNAKLRQTSPDVTYSVTFSSIQAATDTYQLYFGAGGEAVQPDGSFRIPASPTPQVRSLLMILVDGTNFVPLWHPRVSLLGSDAVSLDVENWVTFPITGTFLGSSLIDGAIGEWAGILPASSS
ncbi:hypothetical protein [Streptomyces sp. NBC_00932]|uniref:phage tail tube protein n=1 Tax=Streptomyces sp. NBC_00932 TaxID=2903690 RepID=UPI00386468D5|nr:hypothetical protein OG221_27850 [Streptomyces sp. NBC_00932]